MAAVSRILQKQKPDLAGRRGNTPKTDDMFTAQSPQRTLKVLQVSCNPEVSEVT